MRMQLQTLIERRLRLLLLVVGGLVPRVHQRLRAAFDLVISALSRGAVAL